MFSYLDDITEWQKAMNTANLFWLENLKDYNLNRSLPLPFDRRRITDDNRTRNTSIAYFDFDEKLSQLFLSYASTNNVMPTHLAIACYVAFLFKLTNGECDLCFGLNPSDEYRNRLWSLTGKFTNLIPFRSQIEPNASFNRFVENISMIVTKSLENSYFPLERIFAQHSIITTPACLETCFIFRSTLINNCLNNMPLDNANMLTLTEEIELNKLDAMNSSEFLMVVQHNPITEKLSCTIHASLERFDVITSTRIAQRFHIMLNQLFFKFNHFRQPINELSILLPEEVILLDSFISTKTLASPVACIQHEFVNRMIEQPQKVAVELDEQSLTYSELCYYAQQLALRLLNQYHVQPADIVCQCVERSFEMVSYFDIIDSILG